MNEHPYRLENKKVLVTGGAGFIGSALANHLAKYNSVVALDNLSAGDWSRCDGSYKKLICDLSTISEDELIELLTDCEILFHLAAVKLHNVSNTDYSIINSNILASNKLFRAAGKAGVSRVVFTSSLYANGSLGPTHMTEKDHEMPTTLYGASKLFSESDLRIASKIYGYSFVIPRLFFIYGPKQFATGGYKSVIVRNFQKFQNAEPMEISGTGNQTLDYVYIDDCVTALSLIAELEFEGIVHISSGIGIRVLDLINEMSKVCSNNLIKHVNADWTENSLRVGSNELLGKLTGFVPNTPIAEGLQKTWKALKC